MMKNEEQMMELRGRVVTDVEIEDVDPRDYPDFCDAFFSHAVYADTGEELTDAELEELLDTYPEVANEMAFEHYL
jgi:hypothetical protein